MLVLLQHHLCRCSKYELQLSSTMLSRVSRLPQPRYFTSINACWSMQPFSSISTLESKASSSASAASTSAASVSASASESASSPDSKSISTCSSLSSDTSSSSSSSLNILTNGGGLTSKHLLRSLSQKMENAQEFYSHVTGYTNIDMLSRQVEDSRISFVNSRDEFSSSRGRYEDVMGSSNQNTKDIEILLDRRAAWTARERAQFSELSEREERMKTLLKKTQADYKVAGDLFFKSVDDYQSALQNRYREEQILNDKSRRLQTYWTTALITLNFILFLGQVARMRHWWHKMEEESNRVCDTVKESLIAERALLIDSITEVIASVGNTQQPVSSVSVSTPSVPSPPLEPFLHPYPSSSPSSQQTGTTSTPTSSIITFSNPILTEGLVLLKHVSTTESEVGGWAGYFRVTRALVLSMRRLANNVTLAGTSITVTGSSLVDGAVDGVCAAAISVASLSQRDWAFAGVCVLSTALANMLLSSFR